MSKAGDKAVIKELRKRVAQQDELLREVTATITRVMCELEAMYNGDTNKTAAPNYSYAEGESCPLFDR